MTITHTMILDAQRTTDAYNHGYAFGRRSSPTRPSLLPTETARQHQYQGRAYDAFCEGWCDGYEDASDRAWSAPTTDDA